MSVTVLVIGRKHYTICLRIGASTEILVLYYILLAVFPELAFWTLKGKNETFSLSLELTFFFFAIYPLKAEETVYTASSVSVIQRKWHTHLAKA